eukprot:scaffold2543_cov94-Skeletonema_dohrnii-CCMP3373.AAC.5
MRPPETAASTQEGYLPPLMLFVCVSTMLYPRMCPDEAQVGSLLCQIWHAIEKKQAIMHCLPPGANPSSHIDITSPMESN